jgi:hypothetical protein
VIAERGQRLINRCRFSFKDLSPLRTWRRATSRAGNPQRDVW